MDSDLRAILSRYPAAARPTSEPQSLGNAGGLSGSRLWKYPSGIGPLVARAWPVDAPPRAALQEIHGWLSGVSCLGFVPIPLRGLDGQTLYERAGGQWEVVPWMPGTPESAPPSSAGRVRSAFAALAAFHQRLATDRSQGPSPGLLARFREVEWLLAGGLQELDRLLAHSGSDPLRGIARRWVQAARIASPRVLEILSRAIPLQVDRQPCLRDVRPEHFLFQEDRVTGLIDLGAMGLETVSADLARLLGDWLGPHPEQRSMALSAYSSIRPLGATETTLIDVFERSSALLGGGHWIHWHFVEARRFDEPEAVAKGLENALRRLLRSDLLVERSRSGQGIDRLDGP
ncbi:MAG: hypothetical protein NVSMB9_28630 [Isosphaeraceae bacterium]